MRSAVFARSFLKGMAQQFIRIGSVNIIFFEQFINALGGQFLAHFVGFHLHNMSGIQRA